MNDNSKKSHASIQPLDENPELPKKKEKEANLVPRRLVRSPMKMERISLPKEAAFTGSSFCS